jgi:hypothetical protein
MKRKAAEKLQKQKDAEKQKKAEEAKRKLDKVAAEKLAKQREAKIAKHKQDSIKALAKVNPLVFNLQKALTHPYVSSVASFAVNACNDSHAALDAIKAKAEGVQAKPNPDEELPWNRDEVAAMCKEAGANLATLNNMLKTAQAFAARS